MRLTHSALETYAATAHVRFRLLPWLCPLLIVAMAMQPGEAQERSPGTLQEQFAKLESQYVKIIWPNEKNSNTELQVYPEAEQKRIRKDIQEYTNNVKRGQQIQEEYQELLKQMAKKIDLKSLLTKTYERAEHISNLSITRERGNIGSGQLNMRDASLTTRGFGIFLPRMNLELMLSESKIALEEPGSTPATILLHELLYYTFRANSQDFAEIKSSYNLSRGPIPNTKNRLWDLSTSLSEGDENKKRQQLMSFAQISMHLEGDIIESKLKEQLGDSWQQADSLYSEITKIVNSPVRYIGGSPMTSRYEYYLLVRSQQDYLELVPAIENGQREIIPKNRIGRVVFLPETQD